MTIRCLLLTLIVLAACGDDDSGWTLGQAKSVTTIRGLPVQVRECRGVGDSSGEGAARRYERFRCLAGARLPGERIDTVAVLYEIRPTGGTDYELRRVRFIGGPGIP